MITRKLQRKLDLAIEVARGLDQVFDEMMKTHGVVVSPLIDRYDLSSDGEISVSPDFFNRISLPVAIAIFWHESRHWHHDHFTRWSVYRQHLAESVDLPADLITKDRIKDWTTINLMWNIAADLEISYVLARLPVMRNEPFMRYGEWPCLRIKAGMKAEEIMDGFMREKEWRNEVYEYMKGTKNEDHE